MNRASLFASTPQVSPATALRTVGVVASVAALTWVAGCSCSNDLGESAGIDSIGTDSAMTDDASGDGESNSGDDGTRFDVGATDGSSTGNQDCEEDEKCAGVCCGADQLCSAGQCVMDCGGGVPACGDAEVCCGGNDVCYVGECITPGAACTASGCATKTDAGDCEDDEFCDTSLGFCVPKAEAADCQYTPNLGDLDPAPLFTWGVRRDRNCTQDSDCQTAEVCDTVGGKCQVTWNHIDATAGDMPNHYQVSSVPMVTDLDADCVPEIIFNTYAGTTFTSDGVLRAIRGDTGAPVWTVSDASWRTDSTGSPAVGDIDSDGMPEVVIVGESKDLLAFEHDGTPKWRSDAFAGSESSGSPAIANLDNQGDAEIVFGAAVFDSAGNLLFEGNGGIGRNGQGPISCVADIDDDGRGELIAGNTAYDLTGSVIGGNFSGSTLWTASVGDGFCGVADFDKNGTPEVVLVTGGNIHLLNGQTGATIDSINIPGSSDRGGAPNIADFDGDGSVDIGTAGSSNYVVVTYDATNQTLSELWRAATEDDSSRVTGSSVFDFDGDGINEVVYNDESYIRIYPGSEPDCRLNPPGPNCDGVMTDAEVLFRDINSSRTRTEYPVIADVDGDFKAEIVFSTNNDTNSGSTQGDGGIEVWADRSDNWVATRAVWNQHSYHVTNINVDGTVPSPEDDNWSFPTAKPFNSYRRNVQGENDLCAPDLVPEELTVDDSVCPGVILSVRVVNKGCLGVGAGVNVAFYEKTLGLLGVVQTQGPLVGGANETVGLNFDGGGLESWEFYVVVEDDGTGNGVLNECKEDNNQSEDLAAMCGVIG